MEIFLFSVPAYFNVQKIILLNRIRAIKVKSMTMNIAENKREYMLR